MGVILKIGSKKIWGAQTPQCCEPKSEDVAQTYSKNRPWERVSKTGFEILGAPTPQKNSGGSKFRNFDIETGIAQGSWVARTSNFYKW